MKAFWGVILVLAVVAGVLLARGRSDGVTVEPALQAAPDAAPASQPPLATPQQPRPKPEPAAPAESETAPGEQRAEVQPDQPAPTDDQPATTEVPADIVDQVPSAPTDAAPAQTEPTQPVEPSSPAPEPEPSPDSTPDAPPASDPAVDPLPEQLEPANAQPPADDPVGAGEAANDATPSEPTAQDESPADIAATESTTEEAPAPGAGANEPAPDATATADSPNPEEPPGLRINENTVLRGLGTVKTPYEVPWEILVSAGREYNPREGKTELPAWTKELDGKHVRLTGFLLFPLVVTEADELLIMYNQWDGCCIGIPPTPYDSVEVRLSGTAPKDSWRFNYGSVTGKLKVDPYLAGKWLVSLYILEDAELKLEGL